MLKKIKQIISKEQFNPSLLGLLVNPFYFARKGLYKNISELSVYAKGELLDVGCGQKPYEKLFKVKKYIGLEINKQNKKADLYYDGKTFPCNDNSFDIVISNEVLEHVFEPEMFLKEIHRVLKDDGYFLLTVPFVWDEHEQPNDFGRYTSFGLKHILKKNSFEIIEFRKSVNDITVIFQLLNDYIYKKVIGKNYWLNQLKILFLMAPFNILGFILNFMLPKNDDLYLDNIVLARKKNYAV